ncbi:MAG: glycosyltransferase [Candidatus Electronema sp. VV]
MTEAPLIVHTDWSRSWGGQEIRTLTELREMRKLGFRTALIVREGAELASRCGAEGFAVHHIDFSSKFNLRAWLELLRLLRQLRPAVVNTHSSEDSWMAGAAARLCGVPLVARTRHVLEPVSSSFSYRAFPHVIFACSEAIAKQLAGQGVPRRKIVTQSTGIDEERFRFSARDREEVRRSCGIADTDVLVGNVAFLRHYKGHEFIARTAAALPEQFKFMIVGGGNGRALLEEAITKAGARERFILTGHREDPERYFSAMDLIFFSSYETEGISQSFIQGLLYGLPLLACRTPSILEPLEFVRRHRLVDYGDVAAARQGLLELAGNLERDEEVVRLQRRDIAAKYGLKRMVENIVQVYAAHGVRNNTIQGG